MQFKDFEIRPVKSIDGVINPNRFELVKWYDHEPTPVTNMRTGEKRISTSSCFVVAWLEDEYGIKACTMMSLLRGDRPMRKDFIDRGLSYA